MNRLTSQQRKLVYLILIILLAIPIIGLGMPSTGAEGSGGMLARLRQPPPQGYDLGEAAIGDVDPTSSAMNLMLLGLRGLATNLLWMQALEQQDTKNWAQLKATVDSIIMLQPHFLEVWEHQGWNLSYNVSASWDGVEDRYYWVKEGAKFLMRGSERNNTFPDLFWWTGQVLGKKIGRSDEWRFFREYFLQDPDEEQYNGGPDPEINPQSKDNYLAARDWFLDANEIELTQEQHETARVLFRAYPTRSLLDYAEALQREGIFDEVTKFAWEDAFDEWTQVYGRERFNAIDGEIFLEATEEDIQRLSQQQGVPPEELKQSVDRFREITHYLYWRTRALAESDDDLIKAHRQVYEGKQQFREGDFSRSAETLVAGLNQYEKLLEEYPELRDHDATREEVCTAILLWQYTHQLSGQPVPEDYPLKEMWERSYDMQITLQNRFRHFLGVSGG